MKLNHVQITFDVFILYIHVCVHVGSVFCTAFNGTVELLGLCSNQRLSFFTLLDRASFPHYNNTKIIKFGWELFILWVITYGLSFSGFAIDLSLIMPRNSGNYQAYPENDSP